MPFTTATVVKIEQGNKQFQGAFSEMWFITLLVDPSSIAIGAEDNNAFTVPGLVLGDMVIGFSTGLNQTQNADIQLYISTVNTLVIRISNLDSVSALDLASSTWKVIIGRPAW